jgi:hypothetical protein
MRTILQSLKQHIQPGEVYRRSDIENWTTAVDRHLHMLTEDGTLQKLSQGIYYAPKKSKFGVNPPTDHSLVEQFLKDDTFLLFSPNVYNTLGLGLTQLYNITWVYNHKRRGVFTMNGRNFLFKLKSAFPAALSREYLVVELLNNLNELAEDSEKVLGNFQRNVNLFDAVELKKMASKFGAGSVRKLIFATLKKTQVYA